MSAKSWIVHHRDGWCALPPGAQPDPEAWNDPTLCGYVVNMRGGSKRGTPDCPDCLKLLRGGALFPEVAREAAEAAAAVISRAGTGGKR